MLSPAPLGIIEDLAQALQIGRVRHCQWKGHSRPERWARGAGDIDVLVDRRDLPAFTAAASGLQFKPATAKRGGQTAGIFSYIGIDPATGRMVHLHVHTRLLLATGSAQAYRLPLEGAVLDSAVPGPLFPVPAPEFEFVLLVVRSLLRCGRSDRLRRTPPPWLPAAQRDIARLRRQVSAPRLRRSLAAHLPGVSADTLIQAAAALVDGSTPRGRLRAAAAVQACLRPYSTLTPLVGVLSGVQFRVAAAWRRLTSQSPAKQLSTGGAVIALVGGDGSGKTTAVRGLAQCLSALLDARMLHMGKPPSVPVRLAAVCTGAARRIRLALTRDRQYRTPGLASMLESVCVARARYKQSLGARRLASTGTIVVCDRYPTPWLPMDGPRIRGSLLDVVPGKLARYLMRLEEGYYDRILLPDQLYVLRVRPEVAARRKVEEEPTYVMGRASAVWDADWSDTSATVIDASADRDCVLSQIRAQVWSAL